VGRLRRSAPARSPPKFLASPANSAETALKPAGDFVALSGSVIARGIAPRQHRTGTGTKAAAIAALHLDVGYHSITIGTGVAGAEEIGAEFDIQERGK